VVSLGNTLSRPLPVIALVSRYLTNKLIGPRPLPKHLSALLVTGFYSQGALGGEIPNSNFQIPNKFQIPISKLPNALWSLGIVWDLMLGVWDFLLYLARKIQLPGYQVLAPLS